VVGLPLNANHALTAEHAGAGGLRTFGEHRIKCEPINDDGFRRCRGVFEGVAGRGDEADRRQGVEHDAGGQGHAGGHVFSQHPRAMHRCANSIVFLEDTDRPSVGREASGRGQAARTATDHRNITHAFVDYK
jgi:hypothetical protein